jgi:ribonuclease HI
MTGWLGAGYGVPEEIMVDNGGEFTGEEIMEMASLLNIKINTTASHSPFSNGLCEKNHSVVDNMLEKLQYENPKMPFDELLAWACTAKNAMAMFNGYSPYQIVFGRNPTMPGFDLHPPSGNDIKGDVLLRHLQALNSAKRAFVEAESSERVRRALRHKVRVSERSYQPGDMVYYKREGSSQWSGPAKVIVQDGKVVFIRHGSYIVRIYINRVVLQGEEYGTPEPSIDNTTIPEEAEEHLNDRLNEEDEDEPVPAVAEHNPVQPENNIVAQNNVPDVMYDIVPWRQIKVNDEIMYRENDTDPWRSGKIVSRAGKATGNNASWFNIETDSDRFSMDLEKVDIVKLSVPEMCENVEKVDTHSEVLVVDRDNMVYKVKLCEKTEQAKIDEIQKLKDFETFSVVVDMGQDRISTRWVITTKEDGSKKARLVARGFEELDKIQSDSPTISKSVMRVFLSICSTLEWTVRTTDIKSAFLQGQSLDRDVFIKPPSGFEDSKKLWKLKKCLYGLNDAARKFYLSVKSCLLRLGCEVSNLEPALFVYKSNGITSGIILCHVDDFLHGGDMEFRRKIIEPLENEFKASRRASTKFKYVGFNIIQSPECIYVNQNDYLDSVGFEELPRRYVGPEVDLDADEYTLFRSMVGKINWLANGTRPDASFTMINLSTKFNRAHTSHLKEAVKAVKMLKTEKCDVVFPKLNSTQGLKLVVYTDASLANLNGVDSCGGHIIFLCDNDNMCCALSWHSGKLKRVARSTIAAETMALSSGIEEAMYLRQVITFSIGGVLPIIAITDNKSLLQAINSTHLVEEKRLRIDISAIKEIVDSENVSVVWVPGVRQLADCLTKKGASPHKLMDVISNGQLPDQV